MPAVTLGWDKSGKRWVKMIKGERFTSTKNIGIREANKEFDDWYSKTFGAAQQRQEQLDAAQDTTNQVLASIGMKPKKKDPSLPASLNRRGQMEAKIFNAVVASPVASDASTLKALIRQYLEWKATKLAHDSLVPIKSHLAILGDELPTVTPSIDQWEEFVGKLNTWKKKGERSAKYCNSILVSSKGFFDWAKSRVKVPDFVFEKRYRITIPKTRAVSFKTDEIAALVKAADADFGVMLKLCINCGMTQVDLSELTWDMIDLKAGTLTRMRTKHEHRGESDTVLIVTYTLWQPIVDYMKKRDNKTGYVFTRLDGGKLVQEKRNDIVAKWFKTVATAAGIKGKTFKILRKTGTTLLGSSFKDSGGKHDFRSWREIYLANSPKEVTDVNYDGTVDLPAQVTAYLKTKLGI